MQIFCGFLCAHSIVAIEPIPSSPFHRAHSIEPIPLSEFHHAHSIGPILSSPFHRVHPIKRILLSAFHRANSMFHYVNSICRFHRANSIVRTPSCGFYHADSIVPLYGFPRANFIMRTLSCGFHRADFIVRFHRADSIVRIPSCGFPRANSVVWIPSCGFHHTGSIVYIPYNSIMEVCCANATMRIPLYAFCYVPIVCIPSCAFYCRIPSYDRWRKEEVKEDGGWVHWRFVFTFVRVFALPLASTDCIDHIVCVVDY